MSTIVSARHCLALAAVMLVWEAAAQQSAIPDFSSNQASWQGPNGVNFTVIPGTVAPVTNDPAHPHYSNAEARKLGINPT